MAQKAKYGTEGKVKNIIACTIFVCRPTKKLMVHTVHFLLACRAAVTIQVGWTVLSYKV